VSIEETAFEAQAYQKLVINDYDSLGAIHLRSKLLPAAPWAELFGSGVTDTPMLDLWISRVVWKELGEGFFIFGGCTPDGPGANGNNYDFFNIPEPSKPKFGTHDLASDITHILLEVWEYPFDARDRIYANPTDPSPDGDPQWGLSAGQDAYAGQKSAPIRTWWSRAAYSIIGWRYYNYAGGSFTVRVVGYKKSGGSVWVEDTDGGGCGVGPASYVGGSSSGPS
jgi:hypothetical protein